MKKAIKRLLVSVNLFFVLLLLTGYLSVYISPAEFVIPAFCGLAYPYIFIINIAFVIWWAVWRKKWFMVSLVGILIGINFIANSVQLNPFLPDKNEKSTQLKVISYNVRMFDLYKWSKNDYTRLKIFGFIIKEKADIICYQEFYSRQQNGFPSTLDTLIKIQKTPYYHISDISMNGKHKGIAIFTKHKIIEKGYVELAGKKLNCIYADVIAHNDTLRIYNAHLASNNFGYDTYRFIDTARTISIKNVLGLRSIYNKLSAGFKNRAKQAEIIAAHIDSSPYRVVVCGDFNDTPISYTYHKIRGKLQDAFEDAGRGFGITYAGKFPPVRIDYILHSRHLQTIEYDIPHIEFSDHYPIVCTISDL